MPNNLTIENLSRSIETGDTGSFMGRSSAVTDAKINSLAIREAGKNGLELPKDSISATGDSAKTFSDMLKNSLETVNLNQIQADTAIKELISGRNKNIHETMLAVERADSSLKLAMQVRNKILDAYREIMRMQV
jgi:flagellar hook-basal body complex protein FliE